MEFSLEIVIPYLILCPLLFLSGFVDSIAGGGGLISLPAYLIVGLPAHNAIGTNKLSSALGTAVATIRYAKSGYIPVLQALVGIVFAFIGSIIGSQLALIVDDFVLKIVLLVALPITAIFIFTTKSKESSKPELTGKKLYLLLALISFFIGIYDGFYGPGTGTFLILAFTAILHMDITRANGVCKAINLTSNIAALFVFILNGQTLIVMGLIGSIFTIAGNYIGSKMFIKNGTKIVRPIMILVLAILFVKVIFELIA